MIFSQPFFGSLNDKVYATEMVGCFYNIVYSDAFAFKSNGVCFENIPCLFVGKATAFNVVGVVCEVYLCAVINSTFKPRLFFSSQHSQQWHQSVFATFAFGQFRIIGDTPCLAYQ